MKRNIKIWLILIYCFEVCSPMLTRVSADSASAESEQQKKEAKRKLELTKFYISKEIEEDFVEFENITDSIIREKMKRRIKSKLLQRDLQKSQETKRLRIEQSSYTDQILSNQNKLMLNMIELLSNANNNIGNLQNRNRDVDLVVHSLGYRGDLEFLEKITFPAWLYNARQLNRFLQWLIATRFKLNHETVAIQEEMKRLNLKPEDVALSFDKFHQTLSKGPVLGIRRPDPPTNEKEWETYYNIVNVSHDFEKAAMKLSMIKLPTRSPDSTKPHDFLSTKYIIFQEIHDKLKEKDVTELFATIDKSKHQLEICITSKQTDSKYSRYVVVAYQTNVTWSNEELQKALSKKNMRNKIVICNVYSEND